MKEKEKIRLWLWLLICLAVFFEQPLWAVTSSPPDDRYYVDVELSNSTPNLNEEVTITYKLKYKGRSISLVNPQFGVSEPDFGDHFKLLRKGQSGSMNFDFGGDMTIFEYDFVLQPLKAGTVQIPPVLISFQKESYSSKSLKITVLAADAPAPEQAGNKIFIDVNVSDPNPWKGEDVIVTYKLYSKYELQSITESIPPTIAGFSTENLSNNQQSKLRVERINGEEFYTLELYKVKLLPISSGEFIIDPYHMGVLANVPTGKIIRDFWGKREVHKRQSLNLNSQKLKIIVRALPEPQPDDFIGAVGDFSLNSDLNTTQTVTDEPLTLKISVSGNGNLKLIGKPELKLPPGFETYDPKVESRSNVKTWEYLLIPRSPGEFTLDAWTFSFFNPKTEDYVELATPVYDIEVGEGESYNGKGGNNTGLTKEEIRMLDKDIRFISTKPVKLKKSNPPFFESTAFYTLFGLPFLLVIPLFVAGRRKQNLHADYSRIRNRRADKVARKKLKTAQTYLKNGDRKEFYNELLRAGWGYLTDKFGMEHGELDRIRIGEVLSTKGISDENIEALIELLDNCELALYAPSGGGEQMSQHYDNAMQLLSALEKASN